MKKEVKNYYVKFEGDFLNDGGYYSKNIIFMNYRKALKIKNDYIKNDCSGVKIYKVD